MDEFSELYILFARKVANYSARSQYDRMVFSIYLINIQMKCHFIQFCNEMTLLQICESGY